MDLITTKYTSLGILLEAYTNLASVITPLSTLKSFSAILITLEVIINVSSLRMLAVRKW